MGKGFRVTFEIDKLDPILPLIQGEVRALKVEQVEDEPVPRNEVVVRGVPLAENGPYMPRAEYPAHIMRAAPKILSAIRDLQGKDPRGAWYKDIGQVCMEGGMSGVNKVESVSPLLSILWRAGKITRTQRGWYRLTY